MVAASILAMKRHFVPLIQGSKRPDNRLRLICINGQVQRVCCLQRPLIGYNRVSIDHGCIQHANWVGVVLRERVWNLLKVLLYLESWNLHLSLCPDNCHDFLSIATCRPSNSHGHIPFQCTYQPTQQLHLHQPFRCAWDQVRDRKTCTHCHLKSRGRKSLVNLHPMFLVLWFFYFIYFRRICHCCWSGF